MKKLLFIALFFFLLLAVVAAGPILISTKEIKDGAITLPKLAITGDCSTGKFLGSTGTGINCTFLNTSNATQLQGRILAATAPTPNQVVGWNSSLSQWEPQTISTTSGTVTSVWLTAPAAGLTVSGSPITSSGSFSIGLANDLGALEGLTGTGYPKRVGTDSWTISTAITSSDLADSGVTAGSCTNCNLSINAKGQVTAQSNGSGGGSSSYSGLSDVQLASSTKGDIAAYDSAASKWKNLAPGANGQVLTADNSQTLGIKWNTPSNSWTQVANQTGSVSTTVNPTVAAQVLTPNTSIYTFSASTNPRYIYVQANATWTRASSQALHLWINLDGTTSIVGAANLTSGTVIGGSYVLPPDNAAHTVQFVYAPSGDIGYTTFSLGEFKVWVLAG